MEHQTDIYAASEVDRVSIEIPGMTDDAVTIPGDSYAPGGTGMPGSPLVYTIPVANENLLPEGEYTALVAVYDERSPLDVAEGRDYLIHTTNAGKNLIEFEIPSFVTYQVFTAVVVAAPKGNLLWAKRAGGTGWDQGNAVTTLSDNSIVVTGRFSDAAVFGGGDLNETILHSAGGPDAFIARYNPDNTLEWVKRAGGTSDCIGNAVTTLSDDSVVVTGYFRAIAIFGEGQPNQTSLTSAGNEDIFIARYNADSTFVWAVRAGGLAPNDESYAITTLSDNSIVLTGTFQETASFGEGIYQTNLTSAGQRDIFIARYNSDGTFSWAKRAGGSAYDYGYDITALSDNSSVITGWFGAAATFGPGEPNQTILTTDGTHDFFIARYKADGTLIWVKQAGGTSGTFGRSISALPDNSTVASGRFTQTAVFGQGEANHTTLVSAGENDIFIARYNPDGTLTWAKRAGGTNEIWSNAITSLSENSTVITGYFEGTATFGDGEPQQTDLISAGSADIFIARYNPDGTLAWAKHAGGTSWAIGYDITALSDDSTVVTGSFREAAVFGMGESNQTTLNSAGEQDIFIARFAP